MTILWVTRRHDEACVALDTIPAWREPVLLNRDETPATRGKGPLYLVGYRKGGDIGEWRK